MGGFHAHAAIVGVKVCPHESGADNNHRVGGRSAHPTRQSAGFAATSFASAFFSGYSTTCT
jgi:hypothetical protein